MCVIFVCNDGFRPDEAEIRAAFQKNDDGGGVAWREFDATLNKTVVKWRKGLDEDEMVELIPKLPFPFIAHFRISTCGGVTRRLTHPFPIEKNSPPALEGQSEKGVLFHNGVWNGWEDYMMRFCLNRDVEIPDGKWSDSRAMAFIAAHVGVGWCEFVREKIAILTPDSLKMYGGSAWSLYGTTHKMMVSNTFWTSGIDEQRRKLRGEVKTESYHTTPPASIFPGARDTSTTKALPAVRQPGRSGSRKAELPFDLKTVTRDELVRARSLMEISNRKFKRFMKIVEQREFQEKAKAREAQLRLAESTTPLSVN